MEREKRMTQQGGIVTVSCGAFRCRLEGFAEPLAALAAVAHWLATAPWGEDGPGDPPARGTPLGVRREIRNGALVLMPTGRGGEAPDPGLRAAGSTDDASWAEIAAGFSVAVPDAGPASLAASPTGEADRPECASEEEGSPEERFALVAADDAGDEAPDLRLLARVARAAASGEFRRRPAPHPNEAAQPHAVSVERPSHEVAACGTEPADGSAELEGPDPTAPSPKAPSPEEEGADSLEAPRRGTSALTDGVDPAEPSDASLAGTLTAFCTSGAATTSAEPKVTPDTPEVSACAVTAAVPPVVPLRPRRPVPSVGAVGTPRVSGPEAGSDVRALGPRGTLPPLRLLPTQRVETPGAAPVALPLSGLVRPRRPVHRRESDAPPL